MDIRPLLRPSINWERLVPELDEVGDQVRLATVRELGQSELSRLFDGAAGHAALTLDELVPVGTTTADLAFEGHHPGAIFAHFTAHFARVNGDGDGETEVLGYQQRARFTLSGPAHFTAKRSENGSVLLDYARTPKQVPAGWPPPAPAASTYRDRVDVLRRVSSAVSVGRAVRAGKPADAWFALVRMTGRF